MLRKTAAEQFANLRKKLSEAEQQANQETIQAYLCVKQGMLLRFAVSLIDTTKVYQISNNQPMSREYHIDHSLVFTEKSVYDGALNIEEEVREKYKNEQRHDMLHLIMAELKPFLDRNAKSVYIVKYRPAAIIPVRDEEVAWYIATPRGWFRGEQTYLSKAVLEKSENHKVF